MHARCYSADPQLNATDVISVPPAVGNYFFPDVVDYQGATDSLEAIRTVGMALKTIVTIVTVNGGSQWQLQAGTDETEIDEGIVRPLDYNAGTNAVMFVRIAGQ